MGSSTEHSAFGPTANPWDLDRVPGGSSGGSAAAVAAYHAPLVDRHRHRRLHPPAGGAVRDRRAEADVRAGQPLRDRGVRQLARPDRAVRARRPRRRGAPPRGRRPRRARLDLRRRSPVPDDAARPPDRRRRGRGGAAGQAPRPAARVLRRGHGARRRGAHPRGGGGPRGRRRDVEEVSLPHTDYGLATYYIVAPAEASANLARYDGCATARVTREGGRPRQLPRDARPRLRAGGQAPDHARDLRAVGRLLRRVLPQGPEGPDADQGATSTRCGRRGSTRSSRRPVPTVAFRFGERMADPVAMYLSDACTLPVNMAGLPGISIPCGLSEGLPVGLQFIGAPWSELELFGLARGYEAITADADWRARRAGRAGPRRPIHAKPEPTRRATRPSAHRRRRRLCLP